MKTVLWAALPFLFNYFIKTKGIPETKIKSLFYCAALNLVTLFFGCLALAMLFLGCFFYFADLSKFSMAAVWTSLVILAVGAVIKWSGDKIGTKLIIEDD